jgi:hypothetical protein
VRDVALIHCSSCTDSIKPSLQFLCYFVVINASEGSLCFQNYVILLWLMLPRDHFVSRILYFTTAGVKCRVAAVKSCPVLHFSVVIFWSFGIIDANTIKCWELSTAQAGARGREGCCTYSLSLMNRLNQTESAILMLFCCD